jgi:hypothetical protein
MDDLRSRLHDAGTALLDLQPRLVAGEPWPLSANYGTEPEADWGPREVLAHIDEMLPYWTEQLTTVVGGDRPTAVPFGRVATDPARLARIGGDRERPAGELLDDIARGLEGVDTFLTTLSDEDAERVGLHSSRGEITVRASVERFLVAHLEDHVVQLREILERSAG